MDILRQTGIHVRHDRLTALMERLGLSALALRRSANFAWYTGGADNRVDHSSPFGLADVVVTPHRDYILTSNIEAQRMREEQVTGIEVVEYPWYDTAGAALNDLAEGGPLGTDFPWDTGTDVAREVASLRIVLDPDAIERYRQVGANAAAAVAEVAQSLAPGTDEWEITASLEMACRRRGLFSPVAMAAGDDRISRYRHPIPHGAACHRRVMLVLCAERGGLYANLTTFVHFEEPESEWRWRFEACETILRRMREATRPGRTLSEVFADCQRFYAEAGFPDEWQLHHQGGITGYATREVIATPHTTLTIQPNTAFAWNPSITGAKAEETFVLTESSAQVLTPRVPSLT
jgi:Xaa-Pro aminopeptidase